MSEYQRKMHNMFSNFKENVERLITLLKKEPKLTRTQLKKRGYTDRTLKAAKDDIKKIV